MLVLFSCEKERDMAKSISDRSKVPILYEDSVTTILSDSGIIRYRLTTAKWYIYDKADTPYWDFPEGLRFERFDLSYNIDAALQCNKAMYFSENEMWHLWGNVRSMNLSGERFYTEELFWDRPNAKVWSDKKITIIQKDKRIIGYGFESNEQFTKYIIKHPTGVFPLDDKENNE